MLQMFLKRRGVAKRKRCGVILVELLVCSCLAFVTGAIVLESTSMLVKLNTAAKKHHASAYALASLVEEVSCVEPDILPQGRAGWRMEVEPGSSGPYLSSRIVRIAGRQGSMPVLLEWETWGLARR